MPPGARRSGDLQESNHVHEWVIHLKTYNYSIGAIHIHSKFSDGSGDIEQITKAAKKAGLDWIIITDHKQAGVEDGSWAASQTNTKGEKIVDIHSHPSQDTKGASEEDQKNINAPHSAVYFKNSKTLHEYDSKNNNLNTKPINSSQDLKKYIESKIYE